MFAVDASFWRERPVFITGHTGFKGAWLVLWLARLGARVSGFALPPHTDPSLFGLCAGGHCNDTFGDIVDRSLLARALAACSPEIVIHMAAQALVPLSYHDPVATYAVNVMGTANLLEVVRSAPSVRAVIVVTSDKVYENEGIGRPFAEDDRLGGHDPYSSSKACAELVTDSYRRCFFPGACRVATARAGNVIGGGDWSPFRLVPDLVRSCQSGHAVALRYPDAVRPWQHVLDPLCGYLMLAQAMVTDPDGVPSALNFGPDADSIRSVAELVQAFTLHCDGRPGWHADDKVHPHEAPMLTLDASLARSRLGWQPLLSFDEAVGWTADWYRAFWSGSDIAAFTRRQIDMFCERLHGPTGKRSALRRTA
jgi:CDP-glucose 4,6-dehydratase